MQGIEKGRIHAITGWITLHFCFWCLSSVAISLLFMASKGKHWRGMGIFPSSSSQCSDQITAATISFVATV